MHASDASTVFSAYTVLGPDRYQERFGLRPEQLAAGQRFVHTPGITFSQQENVDESLDTLNSARIHYDGHYAAASNWREPLMVSTFTLQRMLGLTWKTFGLYRRRICAMHAVNMTAPVHGGDTLSARSEVVDVGAEGMVRLRTEATNQRAQVVASADYTVQMWTGGNLPAALAPQGEVATQERFRSHVFVDGAWHEQVGLFYEDLQPGETFVHAPRRTVFEDEVRSRALRSLEWSPQHHDKAWLDSLGLDAAPVPESWLLGVSTALSTRTFGRVSANLGWTDATFHRAVLPGDTLEARSTVVDKRLSASRPQEGIATVRTETFDQHGQAVLGFTRKLLVYRRDAGAGPP
jgi:itaconyl-CoA hydratase